MSPLDDMLFTLLPVGAPSVSQSVVGRSVGLAPPHPTWTTTTTFLLANFLLEAVTNLAAVKQRRGRGGGLRGCRPRRRSAASLHHRPHPFMKPTVVVKKEPLARFFFPG